MAPIYSCGDEESLTSSDRSSLEKHSDSPSSHSDDLQHLGDVHLKDYVHLSSCPDTIPISRGAFRAHASSHESWSDLPLSPETVSEENLAMPQPLLHYNQNYAFLDPEWVAATFRVFNCSPRFVHETKEPREAQITSKCFAYHVATREQLDGLLSSHPLPPLLGVKWKQDLRHIYWSAYQQLWAFAVLINIAIISVVLSQPSVIDGFDYNQASAAMGANFLIAAFGRQEHVLNLLFRIACLLPRSTPLRMRRQVAHLYTYGGLHAGCGISAFLWYVLFTVLLVKQFEGPHAFTLALGPLTAIIFAILLLVLVMSLPSIRSRWRNQWELSHRYGGWSAIGLSWAQTLIMVIAQAKRENRPVAYALVRAPTFWILSLISTCLIYPWARLRRRKVEAEVLSNDAVRLWFNDRKLPTCVAYNLSHVPLMQNHAFVTIPNDYEKSGVGGYSIVVSNAGDWTKALIHNPPKRIWTRGAPTTDPLRIATLFRPIVLVAAGSGIGPCLSFLREYSDSQMRIIWAACSPEATYGSRIVNEVLRADRKAIIVDTNRTGEPNMAALAYALYREINAEAIVAVSSASATRQLVYELEARSVAAFGSIS